VYEQYVLGAGHTIHVTNVCKQLLWWIINVCSEHVLVLQISSYNLHHQTYFPMLYACRELSRSVRQAASAHVSQSRRCCNAQNSHRYSPGALAVVGSGNSLLPAAAVLMAISGGGLSSAGNSLLPAAAVPKAISGGGPSSADAAATPIHSGARPIQAASAAFLLPPPLKVPPSCSRTTGFHLSWDATLPM
jgi:hypothetical protein